MTERYLEQGNQAVRDLWAALPTQVRQVLEGGRAEMPAKEPLLDCGVPEAPEGYIYRQQVVLGALPFFGVATRLAADMDAAWTMALGLRADQMFLYTREEAETALVWKLRLSEEVRADFVERARAVFGDGAVELEGELATLVLATEAGTVPWAGTTGCEGAD